LSNTVNSFRFLDDFEPEQKDVAPHSSKEQTGIVNHQLACICQHAPLKKMPGSFLLDAQKIYFTNVHPITAKTCTEIFFAGPAPNPS
jgi:hypothetical protein